MDKLRWKLSNFMQQRNGNDELCRITFIVSIIVYVLSVLFNSSLFYLLALCGIIYSLFRMLSRNISARQKENQQFLQFFNLQKKRFSMRKEYRIFTCKGCGKHIRVPRKKGKVEVTCPICGQKAIHRT